MAILPLLRKKKLPIDWEKVIKEARPTKPFSIKRMCGDNFIDLKVITKKFTMRKKCLSHKPVLISTANGGKVIAHPGQYWMKTSFSTQDPWQKVCILKGRSKLPPPADIAGGHPIKSKKIADLQKMIPFFPPPCQEFYSSLADHPVSSGSDDQDDEDDEC